MNLGLNSVLPFGVKLLKGLWDYKSWIGAALVGAILMSQWNGYWHEREINNLTISFEEKVKTARKEEQDNCLIKQTVTKDVGDELNKNLNVSGATHLATIDRLRREGSSCRAVAYSALHSAGRAEGTSLPDQMGRNVVDAGAVAGLFYEADNNTEKLLACQSFITKLYEINGQPLDKSPK